MNRRCVALSCVLLVLGGCGDDLAREAFHDAVAKVQMGDLAGAEAAAERAAELGDTRYGPIRAFLRGNASFARSMALNDEVNRPDADPRARAGALAFAEDALAYWRAAAASRSDWPGARRNVERALLRIDMLREKGKQKRKKQPPPSEEDKPQPQEAKLETRELPPGQVMGLLDLLRKKVELKRRAREAQRRQTSARVERDW